MPRPSIPKTLDWQYSGIPQDERPGQRNPYTGEQYWQKPGEIAFGDALPVPPHPPPILSFREYDPPRPELAQFLMDMDERLSRPAMRGLKKSRAKR